MKTKTPSASTPGESNQAFVISPKSYPTASPTANKILPSARAIAEGLLGHITWHEPDRGYCSCPGQGFHTQRNGKRDCRVALDRVPTVFCVHSSCLLEIERINHALRSAIGKAKFSGATTPGKHWRPTAEERKRLNERAAYQRLRLRAEKSLAQILEKFATAPVELFEESLVRLLDDPTNDWRLLLQLFHPDDVVWIGDTKDSCDGGANKERKECCRRHFRTINAWLKETQAPGQFVCPNTFRPGVHSRSNENVFGFRFLVVESDTLAKNEIVAVFAWLRQFLQLRAIVDTAGKSLHGWFDYPSTAQLHELKGILPKLACDPALFKASQPCRLPGAQRGERTQSLVYLALEDISHE